MARRGGGFTLIEMMIVVAIIAILVAIAYPSYTSYLVRSNRAAAKQFLLDLANREQEHMLNVRSYLAIASAGDANLAKLSGLSVPTEVSSYYTGPVVAVNAGPPPTFTATLTPKVGTMQAGDGALSINSSGAKTGTWEK